MNALSLMEMGEPNVARQRDESRGSKCNKFIENCTELLQDANKFSLCVSEKYRPNIIHVIIKTPWRYTCFGGGNLFENFMCALCGVRVRRKNEKKNTE